MTDNQPMLKYDSLTIERPSDEAKSACEGSFEKLPFVPPLIQSAFVEEGLPEDVVADWFCRHMPRSRVPGDHSV